MYFLRSRVQLRLLPSGEAYVSAPFPSTTPCGASPLDHGSADWTTGPSDSTGRERVAPMLAGPGPRINTAGATAREAAGHVRGSWSVGRAKHHVTYVGLHYARDFLMRSVIAWAQMRSMGPPPIPRTCT